ncbi:phosphate ABC transporter, inner membrane subunit PstC [Halothece sp. PCC 7418]|uniref:phosphate ABC transporter permease subunit PstC n=1 Tax=Halothece sp. (strain PCC 7418) TaxID=65093 RepID=UPI0002A0666E|nr:phosphate ABC transporter permease subunit PstC [Halothece sp. PCC 7418]AFZ44080.1 phosphate ABC transporter, inner membrane subunit PstC [Halothece sp. PCC 7418]
MSSNQADIQSQGSSWQRNLARTFTIEQWSQRALAVLGSIPVVITLAISIILLLETFLFFQDVPLWQFLTDTQWTPMFASNAQYGILVLASATFMVSVIAALTAIPIGVLGAVYLAEYATPSIRRFLKPALEALSGIPTVVFGYFALLFFTPFLRNFFPELSAFNSLSAGIIVGILITPTISSLSEDALRNVPKTIRDGAYALGFTKSEMVIKILIPAAFPGIIASITLAISQALGETMIVAIAAGQNPNLTLNPFVPVATMTAFIIQMSLGTVNFGSTAFQTIFTVGTVLFIITLALNSFGNWLTRRSQKEISGILTPKAESSEGETSTRSEAEESAFTKTLEERTKNPQEQMASQPYRLWREEAFRILALVAAFTGIVVLLVLFFDLAQRGLPRIDWQFITSFASRKADESGILAPLMGTIWLLVLTAIFVIPIGVGAAIYLEEYYSDNWLSRFIEINIANLAAVPSIIYGLLGLELFVRYLKPITGGGTILAAALTLTVIVLPTVIIASRSALRDIPESIRQGGSAVGMTKGQMLRHLVVPAALPGLLTGILLALSRAVGETAALIAVGAAASVRFLPDLQSQYTALPVQIFYWLQEVDTEVQNNAAAATIVLIILVLSLNIGAFFLREFSRREFT